MNREKVLFVVALIFFVLFMQDVWDQEKVTRPSPTAVVQPPPAVAAAPPAAPPAPVKCEPVVEVKYVEVDKEKGGKEPIGGDPNTLFSPNHWRAIFRDKYIQTLDQLEQLSPEDPLIKNLGKYEAFNLITPTYTCDYNHLSRLGDGDGGKWVCGPVDVSNDCTIFSLGSNGNFQFEQRIRAFTNSNCKIHTFDCTGRWSDPSTNFHPWCLGAKDEVLPDGRIFKRFSTIVRDLGVRQVDYLKMDIEGYEWEVLPSIIDDLAQAAPKQISFELHTAGYDFTEECARRFYGVEPFNWVKAMVKFVKKFDAAGYRVAVQEKNIYCPHCYEYVLMRV